MSYIFNNCNSLLSLPDISKWKTDKVINMSYIFSNCNLLLSLPNISEWNTYNAVDMSFMFFNCYSLKYLPDISKWNIINVQNLSHIFSNCEELLSLPDISNWNISHVSDLSFMFSDCKSLLSLPDISKWNMLSIKCMQYMFNNCHSLSSLPNISKWFLFKVIDMNSLFNNCYSLYSLPDISNWIFIIEIDNIFSNCVSLVSLPNIEKWSSNCSNLLKISFLNNKSILEEVINSELKYFNFETSITLNDFLNLFDYILDSNSANYLCFINEKFQNCISLLTFPNFDNFDFPLKDFRDDNFVQNLIDKMNNELKYDKNISNNENINNNEELKDILINFCNKKSNFKNTIKGVLKIELSETNKNIILFNTKINDGIDIYLKEEKIHTILDENKYNNYYNFSDEGIFIFEIVFNVDMNNLIGFFENNTNT